MLKKPVPLLFIIALSLASVTAAAMPLADLRDELEAAWQRAESQAQRVITHIEAVSATEGWDPYRRYPVQTENEAIDDTADWADGAYRFQTSDQDKSRWADGAWPGWLWQLYRREDNGTEAAYWEDKARAWTEAMLEWRRGDMLFAYLIPLRVWYERLADATERPMLEDWILAGGEQMLEPLAVVDDNGTGEWLATVGSYEGAYGYWRRARESDNRKHFHIFVDHMVTTELMLYAAGIAEGRGREALAEELRAKAVSHVKTVDEFMGPSRLIYDPQEGTGTAEGMNRRGGTWQRGYFDYDPANPSDPAPYLWSEPKQGWTGWSTWSRGHAWYSYGCAVTYAYTGNAEVKAIAKDALDYFIANLPANQEGQSYLQVKEDPLDPDVWQTPYIPGMYVPKWDFDFAKDVDPATNYDTSAGAIFLAGLVRFVQALPVDDPDRVRYYNAVKNIFGSLTSPAFLAQDGEPDMSLLKRGSYHDNNAYKPSSSYNNGLIWGDYFFMQAMADFLEWTEEDPKAPRIRLAMDPEGVALHGTPGLPDQLYQLETTADFHQWHPEGTAKAGDGEPLLFRVNIPPAGARFYRLSGDWNW